MATPAKAEGKKTITITSDGIDYIVEYRIIKTEGAADVAPAPAPGPRAQRISTSSNKAEYLRSADNIIKSTNIKAVDAASVAAVERDRAKIKQAATEAREAAEQAEKAADNLLNTTISNTKDGLNINNTHRSLKVAAANARAAPGAAIDITNSGMPIVDKIIGLINAAKAAAKNAEEAALAASSANTEKAAEQAEEAAEQAEYTADRAGSAAGTQDMLEIAAAAAKLAREAAEAARVAAAKARDAATQARAAAKAARAAAKAARAPATQAIGKKLFTIEEEEEEEEEEGQGSGGGTMSKRGGFKKQKATSKSSPTTSVRTKSASKKAPLTDALGSRRP